VELNNTYLSRGEVKGSEKWKQGKNTAIKVHIFSSNVRLRSYHTRLFTTRLENAARFDDPTDCKQSSALLFYPLIDTQFYIPSSLRVLVNFDKVSSSYSKEF